MKVSAFRDSGLSIGKASQPFFLLLYSLRHLVLKIQSLHSLPRAGIFSLQQCFMCMAEFSVRISSILLLPINSSINSWTAFSSITCLFVISSTLRVSSFELIHSLHSSVCFACNVIIIVFRCRSDVVHSYTKEENVQVSIWTVCMDTHDSYSGLHTVFLHRC